MMKDQATLEMQLLKAEQCASLIGINVTTWWRHDATGKIPRAVRIGRSTRWRRSEILAWIEAGCPNRQKWDAIRGRRPA